MTQRIDREMAKFGDVVRYPVSDSYDRLASKVMWGFQYIINTTDPSHSLILKTDDDSFINIGAVLKEFEGALRDGSSRVYAGEKHWPGGKKKHSNSAKFGALYNPGFDVSSILQTLAP